MNTRENYYMDAVAGRYERVFPVARYADVVDLGDVESVRASLSGNLWVRTSDDARRQIMIDKVARLRPVVDELGAMVRFVEPSLEVEHISIGGSYLYCDGDVAINDIDFDVIVRGSYFDYYDVYDIDFLKRSLTNPIRKISFTWSQKPRELLFYLPTHPPRTKEQIGLALWPDASTSQLRSSFHDALYCLRRALGRKEWISYEKGRYTFERSPGYFFDVETFEENVSEAYRLKDEAPEQAVEHLRKAAGIYGGDFLEDLADSAWALERQEELRRAYEEALLLLGRLLLVQGRHAEAADAYRQTISHDRFLEEAHRGLMRSQAALGEKGRALRHYEELVEMLQEELGASPSPETIALHERLRVAEDL